MAKVRRCPAGDINGDGIADVIVSAPRTDPGGVVNAGSIYVIWGKASGWGAASYNLGDVAP